MTIFIIKETEVGYPFAVLTKTRKPSKFSLVWTLHGAQLSKNDGDSLHHGKVLPHLFPRKRATYWRSFLAKPSSISNRSSLSSIGKLLLLRKRNTVYTRSKHGFSLKKSKVLSFGGSSLNPLKGTQRKLMRKLPWLLLR
ncbi:PREDICTED: zinc finger CCCH domain-containing protein 7-like isoform X2 [Populus euphratica]|uniref:Zinc finger CCCH domain-containing protein 7-like isoform X2 n=1 Tax=Populus euphratica TaxID=75702 RepID=A0AAJ6T1F3_POPEU|nr:PREDICTED: zinc finger CCCH domain-containing protein 7-like isoform X2 [Populus euphratica]